MAHTYIHKLEGKFRNKILPNGKKPIEISYYELGSLYPQWLQSYWNKQNFKQKIKYKRNCAVEQW